MKKTFYKVAMIALLFMQSAFAGQAINISMTNTDGNPLDLTAVRSVISANISSGTLINFVTYNHELVQPDKFFACIQASSDVTTKGFNTIVNSLYTIAPSDNNVLFDLRYSKQCNKDNTMVCSNDTASCLTTAFVTSAAYTDYMARKQFATGLADITPAKASMTLKLNQGINVTMPTDIGLPATSKNCSSITTTGDAASGDATIVCTVLGNAQIMGTMIYWHRNGATGTWRCTPVSNGMSDIAKYQGKCDGI